MFLGIGHPRSTRLNLADLSDAPAHEITSPALSNQGAGPMKPAVGQVKWLFAAMAIRRSHCQRYARPLHPTTQTWSDRELRPHQAKLEVAGDRWRWTLTLAVSPRIVRRTWRDDRARRDVQAVSAAVTVAIAGRC